MSNVHMAIYDPDQEYVERFAQYVRSSEYAKRVTLSKYSSFEELTRGFGQRQEHLLLIRPTEQTTLWLERIDRTASSVILLGEAGETWDTDELVIEKYQPLNEMVPSIINRLIEYSGVSLPSAIGQTLSTRIVSICSAVGGVGKSTIAVTLAHRLALLGSRVFFLNLEQVSSVPLWSGNHSNEFSKWFYYLTASDPGRTVSWQSFIQHESLLGFDYLPAARSIQERAEMTGTVTQKLLDSLIRLTHYDVIVCDLDCALSESTLIALGASDATIWMMTDDAVCRYKTKQVVEQLPLWMESRSLRAPEPVFLLNKVQGNGTTRMHFEWPIKGRITYDVRVAEGNHFAQLNATDAEKVVNAYFESIR